MTTAKFGLSPGLGIVAAILVFSLSPVQAYEGVLAPAANEEMQGQAPSSGYSGVLAPKMQDQAATPPAGYKGLLPGSVPETPAQGDTPVPQQSESTWPFEQGSLRPQFGQRKGISTQEELKALAEENSAYKGIDINSSAFSDMMKLPPRIQALTNGPRSRIEGLLPIEYVTRMQVEETMKALKNNALSAEDRRALAKKSYDTLYRGAETLRFKKSTPEIFYKKMGVSDIFLQEEREGDQNSLEMLEDALQEIKGMF